MKLCILILVSLATAEEPRRHERTITTAYLEYVVYPGRLDHYLLTNLSSS